MPIKHAIWKVGEQPTPLATTSLANEQMIENMIVRDPRILSSEWMLIGRQEITPFSGRIDLLAIAPDGSLVLIELKRNRTLSRRRAAVSGSTGRSNSAASSRASAPGCDKSASVPSLPST